MSALQGFILLKILFVSGSAFITGGLRRKSQALHTHRSQLNQTLLIAGFVCSVNIYVCFLTSRLEASHYYCLGFSTMLLTTIPVSYQAAYMYLMPSTNHCEARSQLSAEPCLHCCWSCGFENSHKKCFLTQSCRYISSCYYIHYSPGNADAADAEKWADIVEDEDSFEDPKINFWTCLVAMPIVGGLMAVTAEFVSFIPVLERQVNALFQLTQSIQPLKSRIGVQEQ